VSYVTYIEKVVDKDAFIGITGTLGQDDIRPRRVRTFGKEKGVAGRFSNFDPHAPEYDGNQSYEGWNRHRGDIQSRQE